MRVIIIIKYSVLNHIHLTIGDIYRIHFVVFLVSKTCTDLSLELLDSGVKFPDSVGELLVLLGQLVLGVEGILGLLLDVVQLLLECVLGLLLHPLEVRRVLLPQFLQHPLFVLVRLPAQFPDLFFQLLHHLLGNAQTLLEVTLLLLG
jgi:hypothetical protein